MKKHEIVQMLVDKEAERQGYNIEERDAFMAGIDAWVIWHKHNRYKCKGDGKCHYCGGQAN